ncbi:hypothetical protein [Taklimakanibacter deserti]|uniref:hypothetical protein n=1 Tax=Taklimakanibacter deserti TaxID=2267839 RepID=UPI000E65E2A6
MTTASRHQDTLASHAVCAAAGARDSVRTAQFFLRMLSGAEYWGRPLEPLGQTPGGSVPVPPDIRPGGFLLAALVSKLARIADRLTTWSVNLSIALFAPEWRKLPSPFTHGIMSEVARAIRADSFLVNPLFNAYFYRAAIHILRRYRTPPFLVLEHRVDAARRTLLAEIGAGLNGSEPDFLAHAIVALVDVAPVARAGKPRDQSVIAKSAEQNVAVYAIACVALLFAGQGKPTEELDEDQFFAVVGALIAPRLPTISTLVAHRDVQGLAKELAEIQTMY